MRLVPFGSLSLPDIIGLNDIQSCSISDLPDDGKPLFRPCNVWHWTVVFWLAYIFLVHPDAKIKRKVESELCFVS